MSIINRVGNIIIIDQDVVVSLYNYIGMQLIVFKKKIIEVTVNSATISEI